MSLVLSFPCFRIVNQTSIDAMLPPGTEQLYSEVVYTSVQYYLVEGEAKPSIVIHKRWSIEAIHFPP